MSSFYMLIVEEGERRQGRRKDEKGGIADPCSGMKVGRWAFIAAGFGSTIFRSFSRNVGRACCTVQERQSSNSTMECI